MSVVLVDYSFEGIYEAAVAELASVLQLTSEELKQQVTENEGSWPCDSVILVEVLVSLEEQLGVELPMDHETTTWALSSVERLAKRLADVVVE